MCFITNQDIPLIYAFALFSALWTSLLSQLYLKNKIGTVSLSLSWPTSNQFRVRAKLPFDKTGLSTYTPLIKTT